MPDRLLDELGALVRSDGGLLAAAVRESPTATAEFGDQVQSAPRAAGHPADLGLVIEAVYEGYLLHHGDPRVVVGDDRDLALLAGDRLFAAGLERLADAGDLDSVRALADVIALSAVAHGRDDAGLARAVWEAGVAEVGWGTGAALQAAKLKAHKGDPEAEATLLKAAVATRSESATGRADPDGTADQSLTR